MTLPFSLGTLPLPDWLPAWVPVVLLIPAVLWLLLLFAMPFAVLGTRSRLEGIEAQLDDLHAELRNLAMHLGPPMAPLPDRAWQAIRAGARPDALRFEAVRPDRDAGAGGARSEPRMNWPPAADD